MSDLSFAGDDFKDGLVNGSLSVFMDEPGSNLTAYKGESITELKFRITCHHVLTCANIRCEVHMMRVNSIYTHVHLAMASSKRKVMNEL